MNDSPVDVDTANNLSNAGTPVKYNFSFKLGS